MLDVRLPDGIGVAGPKDWRLVADITAEAFAEDPVNRWVFGSPKAIRACFRVLAREVYAKRGMCHLAGDHGATMWARSDVPDTLSGLGNLALALGVMRHGGKRALDRAMVAGERMAKAHPKEPHMYLFTIGVREAARGTGQGHALMAPVLEACDRAGLACYLENSNPENFGFYGAHGFEHMAHFDAGEGGPPLQAMWRKAR